MEALLEKEGTVESWNDERLDELSGRVDTGFKEMREGFVRIDKRFERIDERFAGLATREDFQNLEARLFKTLLTLLVVFGGVISTLIALNAT
jgi:hypothetical protein